jgi:hypothetical protein
MAKIMGVAALLCLVTGPIPAFAFDEAKCNQHCAVNCAGKAIIARSNARTDVAKADMVAVQFRRDDSNSPAIGHRARRPVTSG